MQTIVTACSTLSPGGFAGKLNLTTDLFFFQFYPYGVKWVFDLRMLKMTKSGNAFFGYVRGGAVLA